MIYFGQFTNNNNSLYSVLMGNKKEVDLYSVDGFIKLDVKQRDYTLPIPEGAYKSPSFNYDMSMYQNPILIPQDKSSMLSYDDTIMSMSKNFSLDNVRIEVTGHKATIDTNGQITYTTEQIDNNAVSIVGERHVYSEDTTGFADRLFGWTLYINGISFPNGNDYYMVDVFIAYEGFKYEGEDLILPWQFTYNIVNNSFVLSQYFEIDGTKDQFWEFPSNWSNVVVADTNIAIVAFEPNPGVKLLNTGETLLTFTINSTPAYCKVTVIDSVEFIPLEFTGKPITIKTNSKNGLLSPFKGTEATISVYNDNVMRDLYSVNQKQNAVKIYNDNDIIFYGYITPNAYSQPYVGIDEIEFDCIDILSILEKEYVSDDLLDKTYINVIDLIVKLIVEKSEHVCNFIIPTYFKDNDVQIHNNVAISEDFSYLELLSEFCRSFGLTLTYYEDVIYFLDYTKLNTTDYTLYVVKDVWDENKNKWIINIQTSMYRLNKRFYPNNGFKDTTLSLKDTYQNISLVQQFSDESAVDIIDSNSTNVTYENLHTDIYNIPYSFTASRDASSGGERNIIYKMWAQFYETNDIKSSVAAIRYELISNRVKMTPYLRIDSLNTVYEYETVQTKRICAGSLLDLINGNNVNYLSTLTCHNRDERDIDDHRYSNQPAILTDPLNNYSTNYTEITWQDNGMGGNGFITELSCPIRYKITDSDSYRPNTPSSDGWTEALLFVSWGVDSRKTELEYRAHGLSYKNMIPIESSQASIDTTKYISFSGTILSSLFFPRTTHREIWYRNNPDSISTMNGLDCNIFWETTDGHYFALKQTLKRDGSKSPKNLIIHDWHEVNKNVVDMLAYSSKNRISNVDINTQYSYLVKIPINLDTEDLQYHGKDYEFSNTCELYTGDGKGFLIPTPWFTDNDAVEFNHPWGDDNDASELYSGKCNVFPFETTDLTTISKTGKMIIVCLGGAYGGCNSGSISKKISFLPGQPNYRYNYVLLHDYKLEQIGTSKYFDSSDSDFKKAAATFTYDYNKRDYSKYSDIKLYYHSPNEYLTNSANNTILVNGTSIKSAPGYMIKNLGISNNSSLEKTILQKHYNQACRPMVELKQTFFTEGIEPFAWTNYDGLIINDDGTNKKLMLDSQNRSIKEGKTKATWIEIGTTLEEVQPVNKQRKR